MHLSLPRSTIRSFRASDAGSIAAHIGTYSVARNMNAIPYPYSLGHASEWITAASTHTPETHFAIAVEGEAVGGIGLEVGDPRRLEVCEHCADVGYWLGEAFWGRGVMSEALAAFTEWAFAELCLIRLQAAVYSRNAASSRVLERPDIPSKDARPPATAKTAS